MKALKQTVRLATRDGQGESIEAEVYGPLSLHRIQHGWRISHLRTGCRVMDVLDKKARVLQVVETLVGEAGENEAGESRWEFGKFGEPGYLRDQPAEVQRACMKARHVADPEYWNEDGTHKRRDKRAKMVVIS